jgi:AcrR family transcriptional regulator
MKKRAELKEQTRLRITESTVTLHEILGPSRTSVSAIAQRRSTLYRHFPDELALFTACTTHWLARNPLPDVKRWAAVANADERLRIALQELYSYFRGTERMLTNILHDEETMPTVKQMLGTYRRNLAEARDKIMRDRNLRKPARARVRAAVGHVLSFHVWRSLAIEQGLDDATSARLMVLLLEAAARK